MSTKIGIIGKGNVGGALARGLERAGYAVRTTGNQPEAVREVGAWADVVLLAVPYPAVDATLASLGSGIDGKVLVDTTNAVTPGFQLALGFTTSAAEELQKKAPRARVVKAFNTTFAQFMETGKVAGRPITIFAAGDDDAARAQVLELAGRIGFDGIDAGPLVMARHLEPMAMFAITLAYGRGMGPSFGFQLAR